MFENYLSKMTKLTLLEIDLSSKEIGNEVVDEIVNMIGYFSELNNVELNLRDNYIDNEIEFEEILNSVK